MTKKPIIESNGPRSPGQWVIVHPGRLTIGKRVDIGAFTYIDAEYGVQIGDDVKIGSHCAICSTNPTDGTQGPVTIGDGVLIGTHSTILPNITIGSGSIVEAHSLVSNFIHPHELWAGIPATFIKRLV